MDGFDYVPDDDDYEPTDHDRELLFDAAHAYRESTAPHERSAGGLRDALADEWRQIRRVRDEERQAVCPRPPAAARPSRQRRPCARPRGRRARRARRAASRAPAGGDSDSDGPGEAWPARDVDLPELGGPHGRARARVAHDHPTPARPPIASRTGVAAIPRAPENQVPQETHRAIIRSGYGHVLVDNQSIEGHVTVDESGAVHIDHAKLRIRDSSRPDGIRRQPLLPRTFGPQPYEVRWMRPRPEGAGDEAQR